MIEKIEQFIKNNLGLVKSESISIDTNLYGHGLDSIRIIRLIAFLEEEFGIQSLSNGFDVKELSTIQAIGNLVARYEKR